MYRRKNFNPKILFEQISNRNTTNDHAEYLKAFVKAEHDIYGHTFAPYIFSTDCDGALTAKINRYNRRYTGSFFLIYRKLYRNSVIPTKFSEDF